MRLRWSAIPLVAVVAACELIAGIEAGDPHELDAATDAGLSDLGTADVAQGEAAATGDSAVDVAADAALPEVLACDPDCGCDQKPVAGAENQAFKDVDPGFFGEDAINALSAAGIVGGCDLEQPLFCPLCYLSRGDLAKWLVLAAELPMFTPATPSFIDVSENHPYYLYIETLQANGIASGYPDGSFRPSSVIPRNSAAIWVFRARKLPISSPLKQTYTDVPIGAWGHESIQALTDACITTGCDTAQTKFCPGDPVVRRVGAVWIARAWDHILSACE